MRNASKVAYFYIKNWIYDYPQQFWHRNPALLLGLICLLGTAAGINWDPIYFLLIPWLMTTKYRFLLIATALSLLSFFWASSHARHTRLSLQPLSGEGLFHIDQLSVQQSPFGRSFHYKGTLKWFEGSGGERFLNLPCHIFCPLSQHAPSADKDYLITGTLLQKKERVFSLKPDKKIPWKAVEDSWSIAAWRYRAKHTVSFFIKQHIQDAPSATFLSALITGEIDERNLRLDFGRLGLQHILAISGFHFSFFALALNVLLRPFVSFRIRIILLVSCLTLYFFFLGNAPSILRAYAAISIFFTGQYINRRAIGLNTLGVALILELLIDPLTVTQLSFQLSFLCTLALLLLYPFTHSIIHFVLPQRTKNEVLMMSRFHQHGYLLSSLLRKVLSLNISVHLLSLPVLLFLFHRFPLLSLIYNLFFPFCVMLSLSLFCIALILSICPPLSAWIHALNSMWTAELLELTSHPPAYFDCVIHCNALTFVQVVLCLSILFYVGMNFSMKQRLESVV